MLIAAAAQGNTFDAIIPAKFEDSTHFLLVETDTGEIVSCWEKLGEGLNLAEELEGSYCEALVSGKIQSMVFYTIADLGISRYYGAELSVKDGIAGAEDNSLELMVDP